MLKCNLAVLLAERNIRISKVSNDTGISRTTLTSLSNNYSQGIQLDTLNKLCLYLQITPEKFFSYLPFDYNLHVDWQKEDVAIVEFTFLSKGKNSKASLLAYYDVDDANGVDIDLELFEDYPEEETILKRYLATMPAIFKKDIEDKLIDALLDNNDKVESITILWPDELSD